MSADTRVIILTYHSISWGPPPLCIAPSLFAWQMEWLSHHAHVITINEVQEWLAGKQVLPPHSVVLTFDDGYADFCAEAAPVLRALGFRATVFLPTGFIGKRSNWRRQPADMVDLPMLSWSQVGKLAEQGICFGSHTVNHADLVELSEAEVERECAASKSEIEAHTSSPARFFCYPYGKWNTAVRSVVARYYSAACTAALAPIERGAHLLALPRLDAYYVRPPALFERLFTRQLNGYLWFRRALRRLRYGQGY
jgi:peptidoglycan/xylan/chitin deacetylase (PgdA/CDA1 family)